MKRSDREKRWAELPSARVRFACEAGFLVLVATGAALVELRPLAIIVVMAVAWLIVALVERASSRPAVEPELETGLDEVVEPSLEPAPSAAARDAYRWFFWRRARAQMDELVAPTAPLEERPSRSHVRRIEAEPVPIPAAVAERDPEPDPPGPAVTKRRLELPGLEESPQPAPLDAPGRPRFGALRPRAADRPPPPPPPPPPPAPPAREWNLWDLERRARAQAGNGPQDEEWSALFTHLRVFANADGLLPKEFDGLVRESFGELIEAA